MDIESILIDTTTAAAVLSDIRGVVAEKTKRPIVVWKAVFIVWTIRVAAEAAAAAAAAMATTTPTTVTDIPEDVQLAVKAHYASQPDAETQVVRRSTQDPNIYLISCTRNFKSAADGSVYFSYYCDSFKFDGKEPECLLLFGLGESPRGLYPPDWHHSVDGVVHNDQLYIVDGRMRDTMSEHGFLDEIKGLISFSYIEDAKFSPPQEYSGTYRSYNVFCAKANCTLWLSTI